MQENIRWWLDTDIKGMEEIESHYWDGLLADDMVSLLKKNNVLAIVFDKGSSILGFAIYEIMNKRIHIHRIAVHPSHRRQGIGTKLVDKLKSKLQKQRKKIMYEIRETALQNQLFLKKNGFQAKEILKNYLPDSNEDAYVMCYHMDDSMLVVQ